MNHSKKRFDCVSWRKFVEDNNLNVGDECVFQLVHSSTSKLVFKFQIFRVNNPSYFCKRTTGETAKSHIDIND